MAFTKMAGMGLKWPGRAIDGQKWLKKGLKQPQKNDRTWLEKACMGLNWLDRNGNERKLLKMSGNAWKLMDMVMTSVMKMMANQMGWPDDSFDCLLLFLLLFV